MSTRCKACDSELPVNQPIHEDLCGECVYSSMEYTSDIITTSSDDDEEQESSPQEGG